VSVRGAREKRRGFNLFVHEGRGKKKRLCVLSLHMTLNLQAKERKEVKKGSSRHLGEGVFESYHFRSRIHNSKKKGRGGMYERHFRPEGEGERRVFVLLPIDTNV